MLSCVLTDKKVNKVRFKSTVSHLNNNASSCEEIQSISLNNQSIHGVYKFPILNRINGWLSSNQNASVYQDQNGNEKPKVDVIRSRKLKFEPDDSENVKRGCSVIFIKNAENKIFKLTFQAVNCSITPLYTKERPYVSKDTEKSLQAYSKSFYYERYTPAFAKLFTRRKDFLVNHQKEGRHSVMSWKQKIGKSRKTEPRPAKHSAGISANTTNLKQSIIHLQAQDMNFTLYPKAMYLDFTKPLYNDQLPNNLVRDLGLETIDQKKNKGCIIAKCHGDILKFTFNMENINYQRISEMITRGAQVKDECIYMRSFSEISNKIIHVPIPKNIYNYIDPMVDVRRRNRYMGFHNIDPRWMSDARKKRLAESKKCQQMDPAKKAYDATNGSSIIYEGPGTLNKARDGLIPCEIFDQDKRKYERWVSQSQNESLHQTVNEGDEFEKFDSNHNQEVPDWDLVIYNK